jgi:hypothetical protein
VIGCSKNNGGGSLRDVCPGGNDMNTDIDESDCIVIQKGGSEVGKRGCHRLEPGCPQAAA